MNKIAIEHDPSPDCLSKLGVTGWPIWTKEASTFPWTYDSAETCYFLEGDVVVTPERGASVRVGRGDLVTFPRGLSCTWEVKVPVRKHYSFESRDQPSVWDEREKDRAQDRDWQEEFELPTRSDERPSSPLDE